MKCNDVPPARLSVRNAVLLGALGIVTFHLAYLSDQLSPAILLFLYSLAALTKLPTGRASFYAGFGIGLAVYAPQLGFFWSIFGPPAVTLWAVLAFWVGLFLLLGDHARQRFPTPLAALAIPLLWTGIEYFRSELYYLRFSWLGAGFALSDGPACRLVALLGIYGVGFVLMALGAALTFLPRRGAIMGGAVALLTLALLNHVPVQKSARPTNAATNLIVAGVQVEFPADLEVPSLLDKALAACPAAQLFMLSEYTFDGPVPKRVRAWCKARQRYLVAGGKDVVGRSNYYNTAFVIGPSGDDVFKQAKSVPIQFFKDGLPAPERRPWDSPWGKLGICICYDLSYSRVTDDLIRQGSQALLVPTMDVVDWGEHQHKLHARVAPLKAAEYGVPIFRVASSGVSQIVDRSGQVNANVPFGAQETLIAGQLELGRPGQLPWDRYLAPLAAVCTGLFAGWLLAAAVAGRWERRIVQKAPPVEHACSAGVRKERGASRPFHQSS
jgi:apolipoprotein N-acyltransferase